MEDSFKEKNNVILSAINITKSHISGEKKIEIIRKSSLIINSGETLSLVGVSGSGKTTFLQIIGLLDEPDTGHLYIEELRCDNLSDKKLNAVRNKKIGFIYQSHNLLPEFSALENVMMPALIAGDSPKTAEKKALEILKKTGLGKKIHNRPYELSGGEKQRVSIARAIINRPSLILADEPTGNLDPDNAQKIFDLIIEVIAENNLAAFIVTHNMDLAKKADKIFTLENGYLINKCHENYS